MPKKSEITPKDFQVLLGWLASDAEEAGKKYEQIRAGLIKYFYYRGCLDPEALADETINRVALKISAAHFDEKFVLTNYFYSFAANIYLEDSRQRKKLVAVDDDYLQQLSAFENESEDANSPALACMEKCLGSRAPKEKALLVKYYGAGKEERTTQRKILAAEQSTSIEALHTKVSRLRKALRACLKKCMGGE